MQVVQILEASSESLRQSGAPVYLAKSGVDGAAARTGRAVDGAKEPPHVGKNGGAPAKAASRG
jgi:hypothetical protein